jgi:hypothetical protein
LSRVLRLTLIAPDIVEAVLAGRQPPGLQLEDLLKPFPAEWDRQRLYPAGNWPVRSVTG